MNSFSLIFEAEGQVVVAETPEEAAREVSSLLEGAEGLRRSELAGVVKGALSEETSIYEAAALLKAADGLDRMRQIDPIAERLPTQDLEAKAKRRLQERFPEEKERDLELAAMRASDQVRQDSGVNYALDIAKGKL
jgi:hypothetical protein